MVDGSKNVTWLLEQQYMLRRRHMDECRIRSSGYILLYCHENWKRHTLYVFFNKREANGSSFYFCRLAWMHVIHSVEDIFVVCTGSWGPWPDDPQMAENITFISHSPNCWPTQTHHVFLITDEKEKSVHRKFRVIGVF
jgi:hypothetical protein